MSFALLKPCNPSSTASTWTPWVRSGSTGRCCQSWAFEELEFVDLTPHLATHYGRILEGTAGQ